MRAQTGIALLAMLGASAANTPQDGGKPSVDVDATIHLPAVSVPYSGLASEESRLNFLDGIEAFQQYTGSLEGRTPSMVEVREELDRRIMIPALERLRKAFAVTIREEVIGGVLTDVVVPSAGVAASNRNRILINLHGGAMQAGARFGGQMESTPTASLGRIKVVTVDYRMAPESKFPAASEDVAKVYAALLKSYRPENIGIYGCSAGATLTAQSVAWFHKHDLPPPGAIGLFGSGADLSDRVGDSNYIAPALGGIPAIFARWPAEFPNGYLGSADRNDPLVNPSASDEVLQAFPPTLLISGTRDFALSKVLYTHARLVDLGVEADLHVWEAAKHCSFAQTVIDPGVPEHRQAWKVIVRFFDKHLGSKSK